MVSTITNNLSSITRTADAAAATKNNPINNAMDQQAFLKLFTAQLKNQNPLDPTKNEAFVAQLAQFSQLEATTNMGTTLSNFVSSMSGERLLSSSSLIGKKVAVADALAVLNGGQSVSASMQLDQGADGVTVKVLDSKGITVRTATYGAQTAGTLSMVWDGKDEAGNALPDGQYQLQASAVVQGKNTTPQVSVFSTVQSISQSATDGSLQVQVEGGKSVLLSKVQRITH